MERKKRKEEKNMEKRNVIFLDVDGVLNSLAYHEKAGRNAPELEERALRILADIYKENDLYRAGIFMAGTCTYGIPCSAFHVSVPTG